MIVRKSSLAKIPYPLTLLSMFGIALVAYTILGIIGDQPFKVTIWQGVAIVTMAITLGYGGNVASLKAVGIAPNPGYSLVISKSYVLFTTIVAILFMGASTSHRKLTAILIIVAFSALIMVDRKGAKHVSSNRWITLSVAAFFAFGLLSLGSKYLFGHGVSTIPFLIYFFGVVTGCIVLRNKITVSTVLKLSSRDKFLLLGTGIFFTLFNLGNFEAINKAPNVGYVNAVNAASISLVTIMSAILFKDELSPKKGLGIAGVTAGLLLLLI